MSKNCERCSKKIPDEYQNLLCPECYVKVTEENEKAKQTTLEELKRTPDSPIYQEEVKIIEPVGNKEILIKSQNCPQDEKFGIKDINYQENPEHAQKDQILANLAQFIYTHDPDKGKKGKLLWYTARNMYNHIRDFCRIKVMEHPQYPKYIWKPKIVDLGCGSGVGSNILSQEADFVWGIDNNEFSIEFAKEAFTREKNGIYYSSQLTFDTIDIMTENRELMKFDIVVAIEIIEHIRDTYTFLTQIIKHFTKRDKNGNCHIPQPTIFFISTPNRNSKRIRKDKPENVFHVREWRKKEFYDLLNNYFQQVELYDNKGELQPDLESTEDIILAKCTYPKI